MYLKICIESRSRTPTTEYSRYTHLYTLEAFAFIRLSRNASQVLRDIQGYEQFLKAPNLLRVSMHFDESHPVFSLLTRPKITLRSRFCLYHPRVWTSFKTYLSTCVTSVVTKKVSEQLIVRDQVIFMVCVPETCYLLCR